MNPKTALFISASVTLVILLVIAVFNYRVDPMCYYNCEKLDLTKRTRNHFYQIGQKVLAHPDAEIAILGSSRGQTTPLKWIEKREKLKVINLSMGASELSAKIAFLNIALEKLKLKKVIWYADYFELITDVADAKIKNTPALRAYLEEGFGESNLSAKFSQYLGLIDHNTLEASFYALNNSDQYELDRGSGWHLDDELCDSDEYIGEKTPHELQKETGITYDTYSRNVLKKQQSPQAWSAFVKKLNALSEMGIEVLVLIPPYYPQFTIRLTKDFPEVIERHGQWIEKLKALKISNVKVLDFFSGIPNDDKSVRYWNDGVHFTCKGAIEMLKSGI
ncbi:MAG: hypothetical protein SGI74_02970 [Oligoflexia bacterium]|nr:hypothetical protein [Oligoflexia bacterium]